MPTRVPHQAAQQLEETSRYTVQESVEELTEAVNSALSTGDKFVTVTCDDGKQFSVEADRVAGRRRSRALTAG